MKREELKKMFLFNIAKKDYDNEEECYQDFLKIKKENVDNISLRFDEDTQEFSIFDPFRLFVRGDVHLDARGWSN